MKGILATVCAFALLGSVIPVTFPNDLYYHHHPNLAVADSGGGGRRGHTNNKYAHAHGGHRSSGRHNYHGPPSHHRKANLEEVTDATVGNPYLLPHNKRSYHRQNYEEQGRVVYTKDGGIDWSKTKVTKFSAASDEDQQQQQRGQGYDTSHYNQRNPFNDEDDYEYQQQSPRRYNNEGNYRGNYYGDNQHNNGNRHYRNYNSGNDHYRSNSRYNNDNYGYNDGYNDDDDYYYGNQNYENNYGYDDNNDNYNGQYDDNNDNYNGQYDDNNGNYGGQYDGNDNSNNNNNNDVNQKPKNAYTGSHDDSGTGFAGGIRLAGALPDDGYHHGEGTFYDLENRISTCGKQSKNTEFVAALNSEQMGDSSRNNEHCGKEAEVIGPSGKSVKVTIVDTCKTCKNGGLDLSPAAFEEIGEFSQGTIPIKWKFV